MALPGKKKVFGFFVFLLLLAVGAVGAASYFLTRPLDVGFSQHPNSVEADEANRKLKLLNEAQSERKLGFVRFSEVEINSFLDGTYQSTGSSTNASPIRLVKAGVLLDDGRVTVVTWHSVPLFGSEVPVVWQRVIAPQSTTNGWNFAVRSMRVGQVQIPEAQWSRVQEVLGTTDSIFEERKNWLKSLPMVTLARSADTELPEVRLYTYLPQEKSKGNETITK